MRSALPVRALLLALVGLAAMQAAAADSLFHVRYRTAETVYVDAGAAAGLEVGDRLEVLREGKVIAELEVVFVAEHSASCTAVSEKEPVRVDDSVRRVGHTELPPEPPPAREPRQQASPEPAARDEPATTYRPAERRPRTRLSGSFSVDWESFSDDSELGLDFERVAARLSLRAREIGGRPFHLRIRSSTRELRRDRALSGEVPETETRDRFYELSFSYAPPEGRFSFQLGRLRGGPFVGVGYLDGGLFAVALSRQVGIGAFYGSKPDIEELSPDTDRQKYGLFTRFTPRGRGTNPPLEIFLAGIREEGVEDVSREFVALEIRYRPRGRWSFYQRAEVDLNRGWREELAENTSQLSNLFLTATARLSERSRLTISYDRFERYRTEETRTIPEELFDDLLRQGLRVRLRVGRPNGLNFYVTGGMRDRDDEGDTGYHFGLGVSRYLRASRISLGGNATAFSNRLTEGGLVTLRSSKGFRGGHRLNLTLGGRLSRSLIFDDDEDQTTQWVRLGGWFELPGNLFARLEYEVTTGDELEGSRVVASLGYRF